MAPNKPTCSNWRQAWGREEAATDWRAVIAWPDLDIVDICTPTYLHAEMAIAAAEAGKHVFVEKPFALSVEQAQRMVAAVEKAGVVNYVNHNYRRAPAVRLAKRLIDDGFIGRLFHWRSAYLQDWIVDPTFPLTWHLRQETAGYGAHGDLGSHSVDLARYLVGDITAVTGLMATFIKERPLPGVGAATFNAGTGESTESGPVTVDDASFFVAEFANGALGSFELSRFAPGRKNYNYFEVYGSEGSIVFNLERMNEFQVFRRNDPAYAQGFRTIPTTEAERTTTYANWWPPGHTDRL